MRDKTDHNQQKSGSLSCTTFHSWPCLCKNLRLLDSFHRYWWSMNPVIWLDKRQKGPNPTKGGSLRCYLLLMTNSKQKTKITLDSFQRYWWLKNPAIWLDERHIDSSRCYIYLMTISLQKKSKKLLNFFQRYRWSKYVAIWLDKKSKWPHPTQSGGLRYYVSLIIVSMQYI